MDRVDGTPGRAGTRTTLTTKTRNFRKAQTGQSPCKTCHQIAMCHTGVPLKRGLLLVRPASTAAVVCCSGPPGTPAWHARSAGRPKKGSPDKGHSNL